MRITKSATSWALCLWILANASALHAQDDIYLIENGQLLRWGLDLRTLKRQPMPLRVPIPAELAGLSSFAVNRRNVAYAVKGRGQIFSTDGKSATPVYQHSEPIAQIAFGRSNDLLYFSVAANSRARPTREQMRNSRGRGAAARLTGGALYTLDLRDSRVEQRAAISDDAVGGPWTGAFTVDLDDRVYLAALPGRIYELRGGVPVLRHEIAGDNVAALSFEANRLLYVTGGPNVYALKDLTTQTTALTRAGAAWSHVSYHALPTSDDPPAEPCELTVSVTGEASGVDQLSPVVHGPNLSWVPAGMEGNGGRAGRGVFRYVVAKGTYWVRLDMKGDGGRSATPSERRVDCFGARGNADFTY